MRNKIILLMLLSIITAFSYQESYEVLAHFEEIDVTFDECIPVDYYDGNDGINEKWYSIFPLNTSSEFITNHISYPQNNTPEIRYIYSEHGDDYEFYDEANKTWLSDPSITEIEIESIKEDFSNSIKKWNNIKIYTINNNVVNKRKLVNVTEGNESNYNLIIYPSFKISVPADSFVEFGSEEIIFTHNMHTHYHYNIRNIHINVKTFSEITSDTYKSRVGAHELGHVMGLDDLDKDDHSNIQHHEETLMGYGSPRQTNITYKDIAGVMITMGFHTSSDHKWMYSLTEYGGYKLICSICNGVKYSPTIPSGSVIYESCNGNHLLSSGNMVAVASYGTKDYYKCKYCRYVAPFELNVEQSYGEREYISGNTLQHYAHSNNGLTYKVLENHCYDYYTNTFVPYPYNHAQYSLKHKVICGCDGAQTYRAHAFSYQDLNDGNMTTTCLDCGAVIISSTTGPGIIQPMSSNIWKVTDNGSYKLTNGIIILVEEDIDSYKEGTLEFKDSNSEIM